MANKPKHLNLKNHPANNFERAVQMAIAGDLGAPLDYLLGRPAEVRPFCETLKKEAPSKSLVIFQSLIEILMESEGGQEHLFLVKEGMPANLKEAKQFAIKGDTEKVAVFLRAHPDQVKPFCDALLGSFSGIRMAIDLALHGGGRDYFDVMAELITHLIEHNSENARVVRERIHHLFEGTDEAEARDARVEYFSRTATVKVNGEHVSTKIAFVHGELEEDPRPAEFTEDLYFDQENASREDLERIFRPLLEAGVNVQITESVSEGAVSVPGYVVVSKNELTRALREGRIILEHEPGFQNAPFFDLKPDLGHAPLSEPRGLRLV